MSSTALVIVAIPEEQDPVWLVSSEPVPHLTLLYLGDVTDVSNVAGILGYLEHAASTSLCRFSLDVDRRGTLGEDEADVVFFRGWDLPELKQFRSYLLKDDNIAKAYNAVTQFPEWEPHLTLGYPDKPAAKPKNLYDRISWVQFDRIALWLGDFEGPEFQLQDRYNLAEVSMSDIDNPLLHYGVKGMKWGQRKASSIPAVPQPVSVSTKTRKSGKAVIKTKGGKAQPAAKDAIDAKIVIQKAKKSGINSLSNEELRTLTARLDLEQKVSKLAGDKTAGTGAKVMKALLELQEAA